MESEEGNMAKNQKTLENQYHMVVARCKDLEEQMRIRQKQWDQREVEFKTTEKLMRELCEDTCSGSIP